MSLKVQTGGWELGFGPPSDAARHGTDRRLVSQKRTPRAAGGRVWMLIVFAALALGGVTWGGLHAYAEWLRVAVAERTPPIAGVSMETILRDSTPVTASVTVAGTRIPWDTTAHDLRHNVTLWRSMHVADWNDLPTPVREQALDNMLARYRPVLMTPSVWDAMSASEWDLTSTRSRDRVSPDVRILGGVLPRWRQIWPLSGYRCRNHRSHRHVGVMV